MGLIEPRLLSAWFLSVEKLSRILHQVFSSGFKDEALTSRIKIVGVTLKGFVLLWILREISERPKLPDPNNSLEKFAPCGID